MVRHGRGPAFTSAGTVPGKCMDIRRGHREGRKTKKFLCGTYTTSYWTNGSSWSTGPSSSTTPRSTSDDSSGFSSTFWHSSSTFSLTFPLPSRTFRPVSPWGRSPETSPTEEVTDERSDSPRHVSDGWRSRSSVGEVGLVVSPRHQRRTRRMSCATRTECARKRRVEGGRVRRSGN